LFIDYTDLPRLKQLVLICDRELKAEKVKALSSKLEANEGLRGRFWIL